MHRTEGTNNSAGQFTDGPPATSIESRWLNAVQNEILYVIEQAGLTPNTAAADSSDQLKRAIELMLTATVPYTTATTNYTFSDTDGIELLLVDPSARAITVTLPTAADNAGRHILVKVTTAGGAVTIAGEGAELIDAANTFVMQSIYDFLDITCNGVKWFVNGARQRMDTGFIGRSDRSDEHVGNCNLTYDGLTGTFTVGELVTEYSDAGYTTPTGTTGIIMSNSGSVLVLKNMTLPGIFTNDYYIKGSTSAATARPNGSTKEQDTNITHNFGKDIHKLYIQYYTSTDGTENNTFKNTENIWVASGQNYGFMYFQVDTNNILLQTGAQGVATLTSSGAVSGAGDDFDKVIVEYSI